MVDSQPMGEKFQGATIRDVGMETHEGHTEPVLQTQKTPSPSPAFIKENIDILRTMIKEHDQQAKMKATPRKLAYTDSDKEAPVESLAKGFSDRFSLESYDISDTHRQTRSTIKSQKTPSKNKEPIQEGLEDSFEELSQKFLEEFLQQKRYAKDPTEIHGIKRRQNEGLQAFMDQFKSESSHIKGVPPVLHISAFMHGHGHLKLAKKLNDKIPKTVDEMFERVRGPERARNRGGPREARRNMGVYTPYPRKDTFTPLTKTPREILAMESLKKQIEEAVASGKLAHLVKDIRRNNQRNGNQGRNGVKVINMIREEGNRKSPFKERSPGSWKEIQWRQHEEKMSRIREQVILRSKGNPERRPTSDTMSLGRTRNKEGTEEVFTISQERPNQYVTMGATLTTNCKQLLADVMRENMERRPIAPEGRLALKEKVFRWLREGLIRKVLHPEWITNAIPIKLTNGTWKVQIDYSGLNKACAKFMYPFPEEGENLASLMGYSYKCFLQLPKEYSQIRMAEEDKEKTGFHTEERAYCFTHIPKELKNSAATLQRMMEKVLTDQRGRNVEIYLEEIVVKRKSELDLVQDVQKSLRKLKRVNIKIDPAMSSFGVKEGRKEAEGPVVKKFFGQGEQVEETPDANKWGILNLSRGFQANSTPIPRAWRLYLSKEAIKEGSGIGIILVEDNHTPATE
ncbi:hypothetical protein Tco_1064794 [Tanacetum coccineum]